MKTIKVNNQDNLGRKYNIRKRVGLRTSPMIKCAETEWKERRADERN